MNFVPCVTWVAKGIAKTCPDKLQLSAEELKSLIQETKDSAGLNDEIDDDFEDEEEEEEPEINAFENETSLKATDDAGSDEEKDFDAKYNLDAYDEDDDDRPFMNIADVAVHVDNKEDNYITEHEAVSEDEKEEQEDFLIKDSDNLLVVGHVEESSSVMEVYVYNKEEDTLYVHHDIVLPSYPLAIEWLDFHPGDETPGNYVAVGDMSPVIKIWDLDVVDTLEPDYCLGEKPKKRKSEEKIKLKCHKDAVISLSWNKHVRNILASGSADSSIIVWDLQEGTALNKLKFHSGKVQSLQWHPFEGSFLLSGCTDGLIKVYDCRAPDAECKSWTVDGEIERVAWNIFDSLKFFCSTDTGFVHSIDMRNDAIEKSIKAHNEGVTGLDMSQERINILLTASMDKTIKLWNIENGFTLLKSLKLKVGSIYTAKFSPDSGSTVAIGGNRASNSLKVMDIAGEIGGNVSTEIKSEPRDSSSSVQPDDDKLPAKKKIKIAGKFNKSGSVSMNNGTLEPGTSNSRTFKKYTNTEK